MKEITDFFLNLSGENVTIKEIFNQLLLNNEEEVSS